MPQQPAGADIDVRNVSPVVRGGQALAFAVEPFVNVWAEAQPWTRPHWEEIAKNKSLLTINPDIDRYRRLAVDDHLLLVTARADGKLVGYFLWIVAAHPHYKHVQVAEEDLHFLLPEYRSSGVHGQGHGYGYRLLEAARDAAIARGAQLLVMREKVGHEHRSIMNGLGFSPTDIVYTHAVKGR
jgi:GNAT superfamily N-acetyltransferase